MSQHSSAGNSYSPYRKKRTQKEGCGVLTDPQVCASQANHVACTRGKNTLSPKYPVLGGAILRPFGTIAIEHWIGSIIVGALPMAARALTEFLYGQSLDGAMRLTEEVYIAALVMTGSALISFCIESVRGRLRNATLSGSLLIGAAMSLLCLVVTIVGYGGATSDKSIGTAQTLATVIIPIAVAASFLLRVSVANISAHAEARRSQGQ